MENKTVITVSIKAMWLTGFSISTAGLVFQLLIYYLLPCSRKLDQKILTQLTITRFFYVIFEYVLICVTLNDKALNSAIFALYVQTDAALICWMFVFTKNLYDGIMCPFAQKGNFTLITVIIWCVSIPIGLLCPLTLELGYKNGKDERYFNAFYIIYAYVKFTVLIINLLLFGVIFKTAISRTDRVASVMRTCVVAFVLVSISSLQVLLTDLISTFANKDILSVVFAVINSYQVIPITVVFVVLMQNKCKEETFSQKIAKKFIKQTI